MHKNIGIYNAYILITGNSEKSKNRPKKPLLLKYHNNIHMNTIITPNNPELTGKLVFSLTFEKNLGHGPIPLIDNEYNPLIVASIIPFKVPRQEIMTKINNVLPPKFPKILKMHV